MNTTPFDSNDQPTSTLDSTAAVPNEAERVPSGTDTSMLSPMVDLVKRLPRYARLSTALARDPEVPNSAKTMLVLGGVYLVSPIDLVPGFIPVAGQLDDLYVVLTGLQQAMRVTPEAVVARHFAAVDLAPEIVNDDLAAIRAFVRTGVVWGLRQSGRAVGELTRQAGNVWARAQSWKEARNDQKSL